MIELQLTQGKIALIDDEDYARVSQYKWCVFKAHNTFYAHRYVNRDGYYTNQLMHTLILNPRAGLQVDHIDGNGLNNQKSNLRAVTVRENAQNRHMIKSSRFPGVHLDKQKQKWRARILIGTDRKHLGYFDTEEAAYARYVQECDFLKISGVI